MATTGLRWISLPPTVAHPVAATNPQRNCRSLPCACAAMTHNPS